MKRFMVILDVDVDIMMKYGELGIVHECYYLKMVFNFVLLALNWPSIIRDELVWRRNLNPLSRIIGVKPQLSQGLLD